MKNKSIYYLIGDPLSHSYSPQIHDAISLYANDPCEYVMKECKKEELLEFVKFAKSSNVRGFNITIPHKQEIIKYLDNISNDAQEIGACNTVLIENGKLTGFNTDAEGFLSSLYHENAEIYNKNTAILGCGGAAKAVSYALLSAGAKSVTVFARDFQKALALCRGKIHKTIPMELSKWSEFSGCFDLLVNATPVGMYPHAGKSPVETLSALSVDAFVCDLIYNPQETKLLKDAKDLNLKTLNGLSMLIYQAIKAREVWSDGNFNNIFEKVYEKIKDELY